MRSLMLNGGAGLLLVFLTGMGVMLLHAEAVQADVIIPKPRPQPRPPRPQPPLPNPPEPEIEDQHHVIQTTMITISGTLFFVLMSLWIIRKSRSFAPT